MPDIKDITPYDDSGEKHSELVIYHDNGLLWYRCNYVHGIEHGLEEGYNKYGKLVFRGWFNMGNKIGYWYYNYQPKEYYLWLI